jgi:uncharacterized membrane protein YkoI
MPVFPRLSFVLLIGLLICLAAFPAHAADVPGHACLSKAEQRAAVASHKAIPLAKALKARTRGRHGDVVRARLCQDGDRLVYVLTLLGRSGKVITATVDAASGEPVSAR